MWQSFKKAWGCDGGEKNAFGQKNLKEMPSRSRIKSMAALAERQLSQEVGELIPTRQSLLSRLKNWDDHESWRVFFDTYWRLIYKTAVRAGMTDAEAQDVVQETVISVMKKMPDFQYDPAKGSFKGWLLRLTQWRIGDQFRKRRHGYDVASFEVEGEEIDGMANILDPAGSKLEQAWEEEWEQNLLEAAIERVKVKVDPKHYQVFDLCVLKEWSVLQVVRVLKMSPSTIYLAKHRVGKLLKQEIHRLRTKPI